MVPQTILFDLDDTLVHCNKYFENAMHRFAGFVSQWLLPHQVSYKEVRDTQHQLDMKAVQESGFLRDHFPQSFVKTYHLFCRKFGVTPDRKKILLLWELGDSVYHEDFEAYPHMTDTLNALKIQGHQLHLYTGGQHDVQNRKIEKLGLHPFFEDRVYVARKKVTPFLESILTDHGMDRSTTWMIGNSLRTDIQPAIETGINTIFIPAENEWEYNLIELTGEPKGAFYTLKSLLEVPDTIASHVQGLGK